MQRPYFAIIGFGLPILIFGLQELKVFEKTWLLWVVTSFGAILVGYGLWPYSKIALALVRRLKWRSPLQWPVTFEDKLTPSVKALNPPLPPQAAAVPSSYEQIARNVAFLDSAKALAVHLSSKNCNGLAYTFSLRTLLETIRGVPSVRILVDNDDIYLMLIHVIENKFSDLLVKANKLKATAEAMEATRLFDADIALVCKDIGGVVDDYGRLLDGVVQVIKGFQAKKVEVNPLGPIPPSPPLARLIAPQTHKDHAELFRLLDDLCSHTPDNYRPLLPDIGRFTSLPI